MPTYEYVCEKCGHEFDASHAMSSKPLQICPKDLCARKKWGRGRVKRKISGGAGLLFKGSGFYITDYRSEGYKQAAKKDSSAPAPSGGENKSTKDTPITPAAKAESKAAKK